MIERRGGSVSFVGLALLLSVALCSARGSRRLPSAPLFTLFSLRRIGGGWCAPPRKGRAPGRGRFGRARLRIRGFLSVFCVVFIRLQYRGSNSFLLASLDWLRRARGALLESMLHVSLLSIRAVLVVVRENCSRTVEQF